MTPSHGRSHLLAAANDAFGRGSGHHAGSTGDVTNARYLITVVPPSHLPHDPPHPRVGSACNGYGPPSAFRRGILLPLYRSLSAQLTAIARQYGLPSTGGLVLYLLATARDQGQPGLEDATAQVGPRISDEAWELLWGDLFQEEDRNGTREAPERALSGRSGSGGDSDAPRHLTQPESKEGSGSNVASSPNHEADGSRDHSLSEPHKGSDSPAAVLNDDQSDQEAHPSLSRARRLAPSHPSSVRAPTKRLSMSSGSATSLERSFQSTSSSFGESLVVGKVEFDVDVRRARWYPKWIEMADPQTGSDFSGPEGRGDRRPKAGSSKARRSLHLAAPLGPPHRRTDNVSIPSASGRQTLDIPSGLSPSGLREVTSDDTRSSGSATDASSSSPDQPYALLDGGPSSSPDPDVPPSKLLYSGREHFPNSFARRSARDPLADIFGEDHQTWMRTTDDELSLVASADVGSPPVPFGIEEDVGDVMELLSHSSATHADLSSPIHLGTSTMQSIYDAGPNGELPSLNLPASTTDGRLRPPASYGSEQSDEDWSSLKISPHSLAGRSQPVFNQSSLSPSDLREEHRKSSLEMTESLDALARNLVALSPRALKASPRSALAQGLLRLSPRSDSSRHDVMATLPLYSKSSVLEEKAPRTPTALVGDNDAVREGIDAPSPPPRSLQPSSLPEPVRTSDLPQLSGSSAGDSSSTWPRQDSSQVSVPFRQEVLRRKPDPDDDAARGGSVVASDKPPQPPNVPLNKTSAVFSFWRSQSGSA